MPCTLLSTADTAKSTVEDRGAFVSAALVIVFGRAVDELRGAHACIRCILLDIRAGYRYERQSMHYALLGCFFILSVTYHDIR